MSGSSKSVAYAGVGTAELADTDDTDGYLIHGVALGAGDVTVGQSGVKKLWPGEELQQAAETLEGTDLVRDHQNNTKGKVGEVTYAEYVEELGVIYEAEIASHYEQLANDIRAGLMEVSVRAYHKPDEELETDESTDALIVEDIHFDNLSVVNNGASPSNTANTGPIDQINANIDPSRTAAVSASTPEAGAVATLERSAPIEDASFDRGPEALSVTIEDTPTAGEPVAVEDDDVYETREDAEARAEVLGCDRTAHQVKIGTESYYVPCSSPGAYQNVVADSEENASMIQPGMEFYSKINDTMISIEGVSDGTLEVSNADGNVWEEDHDNVLVKVADGDWLNATDDGEETSLIREGMQFFSAINRGMMEIVGVDDDIIEVGVADGDDRWNEKRRDVLQKIVDEEWVHAGHAEQRCGDCQGELDVATVEQLASIPGTHSVDGTVFAISPDEHSDDSTEHADDAKYPMTSCTGEDSVESAWKLRGHGDYDIDQSTLETRIRRAAETMDCDPGIVGMDEFASDDPNGEEETLEDTTFSDGDWVRWDTQGSPELGKITGVYEQGDDLPDFRGSNEFDPGEDDRLYAIQIYREKDGAYHPVKGKPVAHYHESVRGAEAPESTSDDPIELSTKTDQQMDDEDLTEESELMDVGPDHDDVFASESDAMERARELGLETVHEHEFDGETYYMPGSDMESYQNALSEQGEHGEMEDDEYSTPSPFAGTVPVATGIASAGSDQHNTNHTAIPMNIDYEPADVDELSDDLDEPVVVEQSELESLAEEAEQSDAVQSELEELTDKIEEEESAAETLSALDEEDRDLLEADEDVTVVEASTAEMFDEVSNIYAEELAKFSPFEAEELAEKFSPIDLKERLEDHDEAELAARISETEYDPDGGHAEGEELDEEPDEDSDEAELREQYATELEEAGWDTQAEKVRNGDIEIEA